jgi:hypothetical protein
VVHALKHCEEKWKALMTPIQHQKNFMTQNVDWALNDVLRSCDVTGIVLQK